MWAYEGHDETLPPLTEEEVDQELPGYDPVIPGPWALKSTNRFEIELWSPLRDTLVPQEKLHKCNVTELFMFDEEIKVITRF